MSGCVICGYNGRHVHDVKVAVNNLPVRIRLCRRHEDQMRHAAGRGGSVAGWFTDKSDQVKHRRLKHAFRYIESIT